MAKVKCYECSGTEIFHDRGIDKLCHVCKGEGWIYPECDAKKEDAKYEADENKYYERMEREAEFKAYLNREEG